MDKVWAGIDAGKEFHWACVLDASGAEMLSCKVENDEVDLLKLIDEVLSMAEDVVWATDQPGGSAALLLALLWERDQRVLYIPGLSVDRARDAYRGESKTDARDAHVIADQARMRSDLADSPPEKVISLNFSFSSPEGATLSLTGPGVTRLRETLLALFPALERALDLNRARSRWSPTTRPPPPYAGWAANGSPPSSKTAVLKGPTPSLRKPSPRPRLKAPLCPQRTLPPVSSSNSPVRHSC